MKSIEIKAEMKYQFLKACSHAGLEATELKKTVKPRRLYFKVSKKHMSQDDIFKLGIYFSIFIFKSEHIIV